MFTEAEIRDAIRAAIAEVNRPDGRRIPWMNPAALRAEALRRLEEEARRE